MQVITILSSNHPRRPQKSLRHRNRNPNSDQPHAPRTHQIPYPRPERILLRFIRLQLLVLFRIRLRISFELGRFVLLVASYVSEEEVVCERAEEG
jgi:hypothetical protein